VLPRIEPGRTIVVEERWRGHLWSAVPQRVIDANSSELVTFVPAGTTSVTASCRGLAGTEHLTRSERKLNALKTLQARPLQFSESPTKLNFYAADRWARINLGWDPSDGRFMGWYVNFEMPAIETPDGLQTIDLVLDIYVNADRSWHWKDEDDFDLAIDAGVISNDLRQVFRDEAHRVLKELDQQQGPFVPHWRSFRPDRDWPLTNVQLVARYGDSPSAFCFG